ncbi:hypothetical protein YPC_3001 [Yersinia pestis biovar Medievalis str. Harbin 35]|nr:hypothetical protein YPC_3001 [Yersinia pestis biovar Medievalis str. Harbin 35]EEO75232.1 hypothetical protein YP516_3129 [Yersinia pestis Nepal516]EEO81665.1 hypothetical protein YPF_1630 [Yersinia pestis biovar Orientalis str. India 195]EEO87566.1 hypothetical protein YPH_3525 [Yersinia pestis biovar Orientalis str. PEXU2]
MASRPAFILARRVNLKWGSFNPDEQIHAVIRLN